MKLIGRQPEQETLHRILHSEKAEFVAIYGRRRIGKTYLIRTFFQSKKNVFFNATGMKKGAIKKQLGHFCEQIGDTFLQGISPKVGSSWEDAFKLLSEAIKHTAKNKKIVLFLDEFPWMATKNARLLETLDYYWNHYWSNDPRIKLIICGSSAAWILNKIIYNKGGLHNRVTQTIQLEPFTLAETRSFLTSLKFKINLKQVTQAYIVTGGIPYYLGQFNPHQSIDQNIDILAFSKNSFLLSEFDKLFASLFDHSEAHIHILKIMAQHPLGIGQASLFEKLKVKKGYSILSKLEALKTCGFIMSFVPYGYKEKGLYYKIIDEYTLFYFHWLEPIKSVLHNKGLGQHYWEKRKVTPEWRSWSGYAFESLCQKHSDKISQALHISATSIPATWRYIPTKHSPDHGAQIDLLFDRDDDAITLCEIKYTETPFSIDKAYAQRLLQKMEIFRARTKTSKQLFFALISASGLKPTLYSEDLINAIVTPEDLF